MKFKINRNLYSKDVLLKAAYHFTDDYYIILDLKDEYYFIEINAKKGETPTNMESVFSNELVAQGTREAILKKTSAIRELILARAFASTIIEDSTHETEEAEFTSTDDSLFKDWFQK